MRRDKPVVGLHQHMRLAKASRVTDGPSSGAQWEWERAAQTLEAANLPPAGLLMPTICVCNSSPTGQENTSKQTPRESCFTANSLPGSANYWLLVQPEKQRTGTGAEEAIRNNEGTSCESGPGNFSLSHRPHYEREFMSDTTAQSEWESRICNYHQQGEKNKSRKNVAAAYASFRWQDFTAINVDASGSPRPSDVEG